MFFTENTYIFKMVGANSKKFRLRRCHFTDVFYRKYFFKMLGANKKIACGAFILNNKFRTVLINNKTFSCNNRLRRYFCGLIFYAPPARKVFLLLISKVFLLILHFRNFMEVLIINFQISEIF